MKRTKPTHKLTPKEAVLRFCRDCVGNSQDIKNCQGNHLLSDKKKCPFFKYRLGKGRPPLKAIREQCLFCMNGSYQLVKDCVSTNCAIHFYRHGNNPNRSGIGGRFTSKTPV